MPRLTLRSYVFLWLAITAWLSYEYLVMNHALRGHSFLAAMAHGKSRRLLSPAPGESLSYALGWLGFGIMCLTNLYVIKKRFGVFIKSGVAAAWLDFHIFAGLLGPTLIVFHTNFRVHGLVAVSFWSMVISFASGVVGRYFYVQLIDQHADITKQLALYDQAFADFMARSKRRAVSHEQFRALMDAAEDTAHTKRFTEGRKLGMGESLYYAVAGDIKIQFSHVGQGLGLPPEVLGAVKRYAVLKRHLLTLGTFRQLMGYWHAFHMPFAVFMYVVAVIHIAAALTFRVTG